MTSVTTVLSPTPRPLYSLKRTVICVKSNAPPPTIRLFLPSYPPSVRVSFLFFFPLSSPFLDLFFIPSERARRVWSSASSWLESSPLHPTSCHDKHARL